MPTLTVVGVYIDDIMLAANCKDAIQWIKDQLMGEFNMKDLGEAKTIIGWEIRGLDIEDRSEGIHPRPLRI